MRKELYALLRKTTGSGASDCWRWALSLGEAVSGLEAGQDHDPGHCGPFVVCGPTSGGWLGANRLEFLFSYGPLSVAW